MNKIEVEELLDDLADFYDEAFDDARIERWERALIRHDADFIGRAADHYMATQPRFFPKPAELVNIAADIANGHRSGATPRRKGRTLGSMSPDERAAWHAGFEKRIAAKVAEVEALWPPDQYPGKGFIRFLYAGGKLTPQQREAFEATLPADQHLPATNITPIHRKHTA